LLTPNTPIIDVLRMYPQARALFLRHGMACGGCMGSSTETIENGARMHDIDIETLMKELDAIEKENGL